MKRHGIRPSVRQSVPSIDSGSEVQLVCCLPAIDRYLLPADAWAREAGVGLRPVSML